jgi:hypothetical protein
MQEEFIAQKLEQLIIKTLNSGEPADLPKMLNSYIRLLKWIKGNSRKGPMSDEEKMLYGDPDFHPSLEEN